jgi:hypothetical protein
MATLFGIGQPEMLPDGRVGGREPGALAEVFDCRICLTGRCKAKADFLSFAERLLDAWNRNWLPKIERDLRSGHTYFVIVGAAHLGGPDGVLALLRNRGCQIEQL